MCYFPEHYIFRQHKWITKLFFSNTTTKVLYLQLWIFGLLLVLQDSWAVVSILLYGCTTWTLTKRLERRLDGNYTRMLRAVLNKSWRQHPTRLQLYGHLPPITKTIQVRRTRHAGHCWRSKDELISDVLLWTPAHGCAGVGRPARTYIQQLCEDTGCNPEDLPEAMDDREKWRETVRDIRAGGATWWWWWWWFWRRNGLAGCWDGSVLLDVWGMCLKSPCSFVSGFWRRVCDISMLSRAELRSDRHSQFLGWHEVVPVEGMLNVSNLCSTGIPRKESIN